MKFRFYKDPVETADHVKVVADPHADEAGWLPACQASGANGLAQASGAKPDIAPEPIRMGLSALAGLICACVLMLGQMFMMADVAVVCGTISSALFGLSFDRVMYHCGPQDTYLSGFVLAAIPVFWCAWYLRRRRFLKYSLLATLGIAAAVLCGLAVAPTGLGWIGVAALSFLAFAGFQFCGEYFSSWQQNWPRKFSVTKLLFICYVPTLAILAYEIANLNPDGIINEATGESVWESLGIIAACAWLPAFLSAVVSRSRQFASGIGLSAIGQFPVLACALIYCIANGVMLACVGMFGADAVAGYFSRQSGGLFPPDFDVLASTQAELVSKFASGLIVFASLCVSVWCGSCLGTLWNRWRQRQ